MQDLVELVADQDDGLALVLGRPAEHGEQLARLLEGEYRGGLVQDEEVRVAAQALDELDALPFAGGQVVHLGVGVHDQAVPVADVLDDLPGGVAVDPAALAQRDVLPHAHRSDETEVLVHHRDAQPGRDQRVADLDLLTADGDVP
ncbi:hypothetical protein Misp01_41510 [Microtetraspora sp. NBRC 13810]|nr:hypothetical protein Misp01_41510 [Microtetraspora sp. NBRC 13810]